MTFTDIHMTRNIHTLMICVIINVNFRYKSKFHFDIWKNQTEVSKLPEKPK